MEMRIIAQGKKDPPQLPNLKEPCINLTHISTMTVCVIEGGMVSGEPAVMIVVEDKEGSVVLQTSLDKFMTSASAMAGMAENYWGWKRPEGNFSLMPPDKATRKTMLEAIKKELEEWDEVEGDE